MQCGTDPAANMARAISRIREAASKARRSFACRSCFARNIFANRKTTRISRWPRRFPGRLRRSWKRSRAKLGVVIVASLFEKRAAGRLPQHRGDHRRRREISRQVSQDAYPGRSVVLREVLFHSRRSRLSGLADRAGKDRRLRLLGPVVSGSRAPDRAARRPDSVLSDGHRLASGAKRRNTARRNIRRGKRCSAAMRSRTAVTSRR